MVPQHEFVERRRTWAALLASQRRARALFEGIDDAVFVHGHDGKILDSNPAATRLLGYTREEMLGMTTADIDDPEFAAGFQTRLASQMDRGHLSCEGRHRTKDGRVIPVEIRTSAIRLDDQPAILAVIRDISERLALEETRAAYAASQQENAREIAAKNAELTLSEARYRQLTEGCLDGVVAADDQGMITLFNTASERMFGYSSAQVLGKPLALLMPSAFAICRDQEFADRVAALSGSTVEVAAIREGGDEFPVELSLSVVECVGEPQLILSIRDQTERQRMRAMLARSEKLASIGLLSAGVAHEINNPLAYVANNLAVLERDLGSVTERVALLEQARPILADVDASFLARIDEQAEEFDWAYVRENLPKMIARTREGVQRIASIVAGMRGLARTGPTRMETASVADLANGAIEMVRNRLRRHNISMQTDYGILPRLVCVPPQMTQVLLNLLMNAAQAVEESGKAEGGRIELKVTVERDSIVIAISDNGPGIDPENMDRLFDPFFTTKSVGEGTGLGLSICHGIVTGHGGRIEVKTEQNVGTTFRLVLPKNPMPTST